jgi:glucokinase
MANFAIGVDLGGTNLRIAAVDETGLLLEKVTTLARLALGRDQVISDMCDAIRQLTTKFKASGTLMGVGVGIPGIIDMETGLLRESPNLPGWAEYPVREDIERRLNAPVILENDANAAALGEKWLGAARDVNDMAILTLGTGVGGGLVLRGRIWHGMTGMAGEFGHITVDPDGPRCKCGNSGCVEMFASATAVLRMAREAIASGKAPQLARAAHSDPEFSAKVVYNLGIQGDQSAREIFRQVGIALGIVVGDLVNALNLPMYVIGGGVSSAWEAFSPSLLDELRKRSMVYAATAPIIKAATNPGSSSPAAPKTSSGAASQVHAEGSGRKTVVTRAVLGSDAGLYGAARLPMLAGDPAWDCELAEGKRA